jgi:ElaB/YqjD/DUF883 family membrane-anchored ribosome-binding protein
MKDNQDLLKSVAGLTASQVEQLGKANAEQKKIWTEIQSSMEQYREVFAKVGNHTKDLLQQIGQNMDTFSSTTTMHFEDLGKIANEHIGKAVQMIGSSIEDLESQLGALQEALDKSVDNIVKALQRLR